MISLLFYCTVKTPKRKGKKLPHEQSLNCSPNAASQIIAFWERIREFEKA